MIVYNEIDPYPVEWLRNLIHVGALPEGVIYQRSIRALGAHEVRGKTCHFFAGIGGWPRALRLLGIPDTAAIWTGSPPCQPFSRSGSKKGFDDDRHLWPDWFKLIEECRPPIVFGEQTASDDGFEWLDAVSNDLEGAGYTVGSANLAAASIGAPHMRHRLYFVAYTDEGRRELERLAEGWRDIDGRGEEGSSPGGMGDAGRDRDREHARKLSRDEGEHEERSAHRDHPPELAGAVGGPWRGAAWVDCSDGYRRPFEPASFPLAYGVSERVGQLRAIGNAIVPQVAAEFIRAVGLALLDMKERGE